MTSDGLPIVGGNDRERAVPIRQWLALIVFRSVVGRLRSSAIIAIRKACRSWRSLDASGAQATVKAYFYDPS